MRLCCLALALAVSSLAAKAQDCRNTDFESFSDVQGAVSRVLSGPGYLGRDEKILKRSGDLAAMAIVKTVTVQEMNLPEKARQIVLILQVAFAAPELIPVSCNRTPTTALLLLDVLRRTDYGRQENLIENVRFEIQHNTTTGKPLKLVTLPGSPVIDWEHTRWVDNVLGWTLDIRPGMSRGDLLRVFTTEGGLSTRMHRTYVLKQCPFIKVDVEFAATSNVQDPLTEMPDDKIISISKPYLEYTIAD